ncbi:MAG TPA: hypothetical protein VFU95_08215 [Telluria sp.]|nr:hypothetical protein [Telluria sp.]
MHDYQRPPTLHRYAARDELTAALRDGQFRLTPANQALVLSFSTRWDSVLFDQYSPDGACLVIHNTEEFGERLHRAVQKTLPSWAGIDGAVEYGARAALGALFTKSLAEAHEHEWQFAWRPMSPQPRMNALTVKIGNIESFAEIRERNSYAA